ncbi:MAG: hypothetical protein ACI85I_001158 [Arenicella sp.]|jgi:hypothetical protein
MDFIDRLNDLRDRVSKMKEQVHTEEATKNAFIMPFIATLGYDVFNPTEVVPEFVADLGIKKGEKIDYCIFKDEKPILLIECKHWKEKMDVHHTQLHRYFHVTEARFGLLTNGIEYRFYTDLDDSNKMDDKPFLEFSLEKFNENIVSEIKKFQKDTFDEDGIFSNASDLKYSKQIREMLANELREPSEEFVKFFASRIYDGSVRKNVLEQFTVLVAKSAKSYMNEVVNERLRSALDGDQSASSDVEENGKEDLDDDEPLKDGVETTQEELEGFMIIQAILRKVVALDRVFSRDTKSYFGVLLDDNNRKPICRLHFNSSNKYISLFDEDRKGEKIGIERLEDIYTHEERIQASVQQYIGESE